MFIRRIALGLVVFASTSAIATGQHSKHQGHGAKTAETVALPLQPGQGAFAAIAEIVDLLTNDPRTDWSKVRIDALRQHLVDMNMLTLNARVETVARPDAIVFRVSGTDRTLEAIRRMVPAHAQELNEQGAWTATSANFGDGVILTISTPRPDERARLKALGFFGVMSVGAHHQEHHLSIATGTMHGH